jgi:di/tricarboxylate transporter
MTFEIGLTLAILALAVVLFISERLPIDLVALIVLAALALTGLVSAEQALAGFSNAAIVTVWGVFILSGGLTRTGLAGEMGQWILRFGRGNAKTLVILLFVSAFLSAFMNNVGVTAMLLPVVVDVARRTGGSTSKMLLPLAFSTLLGGMTTLIGTPANILASDALREAGLAPLSLFAFAPVGALVALGGILFLLIVSPWAIPDRRGAEAQGRPAEQDIEETFAIGERLYTLQIPENSTLAGRTLAQSHVGSALQLNVVGVIRNGQTWLAPAPEYVLHGEDQLLVTGRLDRLEALSQGQQLVLDEENLELRRLTSTEVHLAEVSLSPRSAFIGKTLEEMNFRSWIGANVLAIWRDGAPRRVNLQAVPIEEGDTLLIQTRTAQLEALRQSPDFLVSKADSNQVYQLEDRLLVLHVPQDSSFADKTLLESKLADAYGLTVLGIIRGDETILLPQSYELITVGDKLLVKGKPEDVSAFQGLQTLEMESSAPVRFTEMQSDHIGAVEIILSPGSRLAGKTLRQVNFREKYGLSVLALWRNGRAYRSNIRDFSLGFGDALLLYGHRSRLKLLASEPDFLVLTSELREAPRDERMLHAGAIMLGVVFSVVLGLLPIQIAVVVGSTLMVLTGCLTMDEAYRAIDWRAVFLFAGMLPLGTAMQTSGAAQFLADGVVWLAAPYGPTALMAGLYLLAALASQVMPNAVVALIMAPIAITTAAQLGYSPTPLVILVAIAASSGFMTPVAPANMIVMGPGGYRFSDYVRIGLPLTLVTLLVTLLALPLFWPL